jgi:hypothetical protein
MWPEPFGKKGSRLTLSDEARALVGVIADDLTGANATGILLRGRGFRIRRQAASGIRIFCADAETDQDILVGGPDAAVLCVSHILKEVHQHD